MIMANEGAVLMRGDAIQLCAELTEIMVGMREKMPDVFIAKSIELAFNEDVKKDANIRMMDKAINDLFNDEPDEPNGLDAFFKAMDKVKGEMENGF